jgi:hypothetical protein
VLDWANHETPGATMAVTDIVSHWEYCMPSCPGRKIDPAGPSPWLPSPSKAPKYSNIWDMDKFRASVLCPDGSPAQPHTEEDDMVIYAFTNYSNTWSQSGVALSPEAFSALVAQGAVVVTSQPTPST